MDAFNQKGNIKIAGLGPGPCEQLPSAAIDAMKAADVIVLRTRIHPAVAMLDSLQIGYESFDTCYDNAETFEEVYSHIVDEVTGAAARGSNVVYAVPGHPCVGEKTVFAIRNKAMELGIEVEVIPAASFIDACMTSLAIDPFEGLLVLDGADMRENEGEKVQPNVNLLVSQVYSRFIASDVKLVLSSIYPDDHVVTVIRGAGLGAEERIEEIPLFKLDRLDWFDHLTSLFVPKMQQALREDKCRFPADRLIDIMEQLRGPEGCPWDRKQDMDSLKKYLVEETYEVLEAIDERNDAKHLEELGDLLLQVVFQAQIAREKGSFDFNDVVNVICEKMIRRHPHVFADVIADDSNAVLRNWEIIKLQEKKAMGAGEDESIMSGVPKNFPALMRAEKLQAKASRVGFDWSDVRDAELKVREEEQELRNALANDDSQNKFEEVGDLLFACVNVSRLLGIDPEEALRVSCDKFIRRFKYIEDKARNMNVKLGDMSLESMDEIWNEAKHKGL